MFDEEIALKIQEEVKIKGYMLVKEEKDYLGGYILVTYYYANKTEKDNHIILMTNQGYTLEVDKNEGLYCNLMYCEYNIYVPMAVYKKEI